jgi:hypothetical protein
LRERLALSQLLEFPFPAHDAAAPTLTSGCLLS